MVGTSTLQSAVLKDGVNTNTMSFDLRSWQGLTLVLKTGKEFLTEPGAYAEFRNLVLQYAQQGGDVEIKKQIDTIISTFGKSQEKNIAVSSEIQIDSPQRKLFVESITRDDEVRKEDKVLSVKTVGRRVAPQFFANETGQEDINATPQKVSNTLVGRDSVIVDAPLTMQRATQEVIDAEPEQTHGTPRTLEEYRARTSEIKRAVHEHIGNPVALMGTKDGKGKVYMTALLGALKATAPGAGGSVEDAMRILEEAYADLIAAQAATSADVLKREDIPESVEKVENVAIPHLAHELSKKEEKNETALQMPLASTTEDVLSNAEFEESVRTPSESTVTEEEVIKNIIPVKRENIRSAFTRSDGAIANVVHALHRSKSLAVETSLPRIDTQGETRVAEPVASIVSHEEERSEALPVLPHREGDREVETSVLAIPQAQDVLSSVPIPSKDIFEEPVHVDDVTIEEQKEGSVAEKKQEVYEKPHEAWTSRGRILSPSEESIREQGIDLKQVMVKQSELSSSHITTMLDTLLHEWNIFSGSGLFGIGPGGLAHPLFRKLCPLTMGEVIAGRWEGTDPKIVKVIKQYVDAWRHEQGITYTTNETFEHYLRRVVQRILKRQER